ncbi:MAG: membrane protein insertion efficiency factor YidD [Planctomycetaceae bacterium]
MNLLSTLLWPADRTLALLAYVGVAGYRRWISPHKGFVCAHGALTREPSCSAFALRAFGELTLSQALPLIRLQFARCRHTYAVHRNDLIDSANAHLSQFRSLAAAGVLACPCLPDEGDKGPLGQLAGDKQSVPNHDSPHA